MNRQVKFLLFLLLVAITTILVSCKPIEGAGGGNSPPEFVGTWQLSPMEIGRGALTVTLTATSFTITAADAPPPSPDLETDTGTVTDVDTTLKHFKLTVKSVTLAGGQSAKWVVGDVIFTLYSVSGNTLTGNMSTTGYPADLTGGVALTRL